MRKIDLLYGALIGFVACFAGCWLFIAIFTKFDFVAGVSQMHAHGNLGKVMALGAIFNVIIFFVLLRMNRELMARGVVLGTILLTVITLFV